MDNNDNFNNMNNMNNGNPPVQDNNELELPKLAPDNSFQEVTPPPIAENPIEIPNQPINTEMDQNNSPLEPKAKKPFPLIIFIGLIVIAAIIVLVVMNLNKETNNDNDSSYSENVQSKEETKDTSTNNTPTPKESDTMSTYDALLENTVKKEDLYIDFGDHRISLESVKLSDFVNNGWVLDDTSVGGFSLKKDLYSGLYVYFENLKTPEGDFSREDLFSANLDNEIVRLDFSVPPKKAASFLGLVAVSKDYGQPTSDVAAAKLLMKLCLRGFQDSRNRTLDEIAEESNKNFHANMSTKFIVDNRYYFVEYLEGQFLISFKNVTREKNYNGDEWAEWYEPENGYYNTYKDEVQSW